MQLVPNDLSRSSRVVSHFVAKSDKIKRFFPNNFTNPQEIFGKILSSSRKRTEIVASISHTMSNLHLSAPQSDNLKLLEYDNTLCVVTGQQVGLFGGPLYTLSKAYSQLSETKRLKRTYPAYNFVPIFWIADNDHDAEEAGKTYIYNRDYSPIELKADFDSRPVPVAQRLFGQDIRDLIDEVADTLWQSRYTKETLSSLNEIYRSDRNWSECYTEFLNLFLAEQGLLFISAEKIRESGHFAPLAWRELNNNGNSKRLIERTNSELKARKFHIQATASDVNLFYHKDGERISINTDEIDLYREIFKNSSTLFSPKVLMRPVMQDSFLPTVLYVAGPGEISYWMQTVDLYHYYGVTMPQITLRKSITFYDNRTIRFLEKHKIAHEIFLQHQDEFVQKLSSFLLDENTESVFLKSELKLKEIYDELSVIAVAIDNNLSKSLAVAYIKSLEQIEHIRKRTISAQKKNREELTDRYMQTRNLLLPTGKYQERFYSILNILVSEGLEATKKLFSEFFITD